MARISAVIIAKNEAAFIGECIDGLGWADEVVVLDSGSQDDTCAVAAAAGAVVYQQEWLGFPAQRNRAAQLAANDWIFQIDADDRATFELDKSVRAAKSGNMAPRDGYSVDRRGIFFGATLPSQSRKATDKLVRLYNRRYSAYDETAVVHEKVVVPGRVHSLNGALLHSRHRSIDDFVTTFNRYATLEAQLLADRVPNVTGFRIITQTLARFGWHYIFGGCFRLGTRGLIYSCLKALSEFVRYAKLWELRQEHVDESGKMT